MRDDIPQLFKNQQLSFYPVSGCACHSKKAVMPLPEFSLPLSAPADTKICTAFWWRDLESGQATHHHSSTCLEKIASQPVWFPFPSTTPITYTYIRDQAALSFPEAVPTYGFSSMTERWLQSIPIIFFLGLKHIHCIFSPEPLSDSA